MDDVRPAAWAAALVALASLAAGGCERVVDAVGVDPCVENPNLTECTPVVWPNQRSVANSDPWLISHHDAITEMHPKVLVLHFVNGRTVEFARQRAQMQVAALAEGSRYHGYADAASPVFLQYEIERVVDLTDNPIPADWPNVSSTLVPLTAAGQFNPEALFSQTYAELYKITDPSEPGRNLTLCELFERGKVHEVWLHVGEPGSRAPPNFLERKQVYDAAGSQVSGVFQPCVGGDCLGGITCGVTVRMAHLSPNRGAGCDLMVRSFGIENMPRAIPALTSDMEAFLNRDFRARFGSPFDSWDDVCDSQATQCVSYPMPTIARSYAGSWIINPFLQGCGNVVFPPNARWRWDYGVDPSRPANTEQVQSRCEHFGMRDGPDGNDLTEIYTSDRTQAYDERVGTDCGGGWQVYWRQSMPGWHNHATAADGSPMKNWWAYLFY